MAGKAKAGCFSDSHRLRDHLTRIFALLLDPNDKVRSRAAKRRAEVESCRARRRSDFGPGWIWVQPHGAGPGVLVAWLPENYQGPLKLNDRIVAISGKELRDAREYTDLMEKTFEEKPAAVMVEQGKERVRLETRIVLPKRQEAVSARVQGSYLSESAEVQIISRAVSQMKIEIPNAWAPVTISWNGSGLEKAETGGCWVLKEEKALPAASKCAP